MQDSKSTSGGLLCVFGSHTFVLVLSMCKKRTAVSHSSAESELFSLDAGLRMNRLPALEYWEFALETLSCKRAGGKCGRHRFEELSLDPNIPKSSHSIQHYILEDNAWIIQMINKGRNPTQRHVTRTHRVDLDWFFERLNLDHSILIKHVRTSDQLAVILTKNCLPTMQRNNFLTMSHMITAAFLANRFLAQPWHGFVPCGRLQSQHGC